MIYYTEHPSPLGELVLAATEHGLCGVYFEEHKYFKGVRDWNLDSRHPHLIDAATQLDDYFAGRRVDFDIALDLRGTPFQRAIWGTLLTLPFGSTISYRSIAERVANPRATRAAGTAIGRNPVSIIVPCHRVVGTSGALSGYAGGLGRKQYLLTHEKVKPLPLGARSSEMTVGG
jgi:methylated-DNA-[protein]-cysteine S-methyltransferase